MSPEGCWLQLAGEAIPNPGFMAADEPGVRMNTRAVCAAAEGCAPWDVVYVRCAGGH